MAFPEVGSRSTGATTAVDTTSHTITLPSGIQVGDLLLVVFSVDGNPTVTVNTGSSGSNWKKIGQASNSTVVTGAVFWKHAEGSDALVLTSSASEQSSHVCLRVVNAGPPTATSANGSSTNSDPASENALVADDYLWVATRSGDSTVVATAAPTNYSQLQTQAAAGTGGASTNTAERTVNGSSENPGTFTSNTEQWVTWTVSVPPRVMAVQTVVDAFGDGTIDTGLWSSFGASVSETGGVLRPSVTGINYAGVTSVGATNFSEKMVGCQVVDAGDQAGIPSLEVNPGELDVGDDANQVFWLISQNTAGIYKKVANVQSTLASPTYNSSAMRYFAIGCFSGNIVWLWSADGTYFRRAWTLANPFGTTSFETSLYAGIWDVGSDTVDFDNYSTWTLSVQAPFRAPSRRGVLGALLQT